MSGEKHDTGSDPLNAALDDLRAVMLARGILEGDG